MSDAQAGVGPNGPTDQSDIAPGDEHGAVGQVSGGVGGYVIGLALAAGLTVLSFALPGTHLVWAPGIPVALVVFAIAQMGVHLVFFLHITTAPDNTNNVLALAFGVLIVALLIGGSLWIMANLNHNMMPMDTMMRMQR
jgi:cytochrome o ubiquinol oxidase operon protein cyoD